MDNEKNPARTAADRAAELNYFARIYLSGFTKDQLIDFAMDVLDSYAELRVEHDKAMGIIR